VEKRIKIGLVILEVIDLCRPCRHLSEKLERDDIIKEFLRKGGIRCQIINDGKISVGDQIKVI
jgi:MOSC domain-containing protein YiiM